MLDELRRSTALIFLAMNPTSLAVKAAKVLVNGPFTLVGVERALANLRGGRRTKLLAALARRLVKKFGDGKRPRMREVSALLESSAAFRDLFPSLIERTLVPSMRPAEGAPQTWAVPAIASVPELCAWLGIGDDSLQWLSASWRADHERMGHYRYRWIPRRGKLPRLIEAPLAFLKSVQQRILHGILERIPAHSAAHGFIKKRGIVSFATPHVGRRCVLRMDVQNFFPTIRRGRVLRVFLTAGYPEAVAGILANLCTAFTPSAVVRENGAMRELLRERHLPQGAPTSPALANLCAFTVDARLAGLAEKFGARYTRYADDLLLSGGDLFRRDVHRCEVFATAILLEEGFAVACRKTRIMPSSVSQRAAGLVLNAHVAVPRRERDILKAILTNCLRHGAASQNRSGHPEFAAHLLGRIAHVAHVHPANAEKLRALYDQIEFA